MKHLEGIKSLHVTDPVGAQVTLGRKGRGVVEKDRFHIVSPYADANNVRPYLGAFRAFNEAAPEHRRFIRANLIYGKLSQSYTYRLRMRDFPKYEEEPKARPNHVPVCEGNGEVAQRWTRHEDVTRTIVCPDEHCQYRQSEPPMCKPFSEILFRPHWGKGTMPTPVCRLRSETGWRSAAAIVGFFRQLDEQARELGLQDATFFGFPFTIQLVERTNPVKRQKAWVIVLTPDTDAVSFFQTQRAAIRELQAPLPLEAIPDLREREDEPLQEMIEHITVGEDK